MNLAEFSIKNRLIMVLIILLSVFGGWNAYQTMPRFEDPEFTIRTAQVLTQYPGASAEEVADEVSDALETAIQELQEVDDIRATARAGFSEIEVDIKFDFSPDKSALQGVWTKLRNKVNDAYADLPPGASQPIVFDEFGDVYGVYYLLTGEGYSPRELLEYAKALRTELLQIEGVAKVSFAGEQTETIYVEISRERASALGLSLNSIFSALETQNSVLSAGDVKIGETRVEISPSGSISSLDAIKNLLVSTSTDSRLIYLQDVADVYRDYADPPSQLIRYDAQPALAIGISNVTGANVVKMGEAIDAALAASETRRPIGMELNEFYHQGKVVNASIVDFFVNVAMAVAIVLITLLIFMGLRSGIVIGLGLVLTIAATLAVMQIADIPMHRISLGALIIALGMLVDNAIVVTEGVLVGTQAGKRKLDVAKDIVSKSVWPLFGGTVVGILAFAPVGFAPGETAEYTGHLFWVIMISLLFSWIFALTITPFLCDLLFKEIPLDQVQEKKDGRLTQLFKSFVRLALHGRYVFVAAAIALFATAVWGFGFVKGGFFPASTTPQIVVDYWLPENVDISTTAADMQAMEAHVAELDGVEHVQTLIGGGALRYMLIYAFESQNASYGQLLVQTESFDEIPGLIPVIQDYLDERFPNGQGKVWRFTMGPGGGSKIEAKFSGPDPNVLRRLADEAKAIIIADGRAISIKDDWRQRVSVIEPIYSERAGRQLGISREDFANALQTNFSGRRVGVYRDGDTLIPIVSRAPANERRGIVNIREIEILSSATGQTVPLGQVADGITTNWRNAQLIRENRVWTIKAQADPRPDELASELLARVQGPIEAIPLPDGYDLTWDGEIGNSEEANASLASTFPIAFGAMILTVILLFNSIRQPLVIWLLVPLIIVGVVVGLVLTQIPLEFMGLLGLLSLSGLLIKNAIVLVDQMDLEISEGKPRFDAVVDSAASRVRPVLMGSLTTILGVLPLITDAFFRSMAVVLVFGLSFATVLTLIGAPVLYAIFFGIRSSETALNTTKAS
ncbi:MAG: efflux RND transporter permease subunit [Pseudomonadota bacterium]